jgi:K+ transporter
VLSNLLTGCALIDIIFGSLVTLLAGAFTCITGIVVKNTVAKIAIGGIFPVMLNASLLPLIWIWCYGQIEYMYIIQALFLFASQTLSVYLVGVPLYLSIKKLKEKGLSFFE